MMAMAVTTEGPPPAGAQGPPPALPLPPPQGSERFQPSAAEVLPHAGQGGPGGRQAEVLAANGTSRAPASSGADALPSR